MLSWAVIVYNSDLCIIVCQEHGTQLSFKLLMIRISLSVGRLCAVPRWTRLLLVVLLSACMKVLLLSSKSYPGTG